MLDTAIARPFPTARCVHAGLGRPHSRGGANGRHRGKGLGGRCSAISLPLSGDIRERCPLPLALYPPAPHVRRRSVARLSEHTGGLGAPQAVGLEAPPRVVSHSGGERIGMRDGGESRTLPRRSDPHPPIGGLVLVLKKNRYARLVRRRCYPSETTLRPLARRWRGAAAPRGGGWRM